MIYLCLHAKYSQGCIVRPGVPSSCLYVCITIKQLPLLDNDAGRCSNLLSADRLGIELLDPCRKLLNLLVSEQNTQTSESIADTDSHGADHFNIFNVCSHHDHHASCDWIRCRIPRFIEILDLAGGFLSWPGDICENQEVDEYVIHFLFWKVGTFESCKISSFGDGYWVWLGPGYTNILDDFADCGYPKSSFEGF